MELESSLLLVEITAVVNRLVAEGVDWDVAAETALADMRDHAAAVVKAHSNSFDQRVGKALTEKRAADSEVNLGIEKLWPGAREAMDRCHALARTLGHELTEGFFDAFWDEDQPDLAEDTDYLGEVRSPRLNKSLMVLSLHALGVTQFAEITTLFRAGLAVGAAARLRALLETATIVSLVAEANPDLALRLHDQARVEHGRYLRGMAEQATNLGWSPPSAGEVEEADSRADNAVARWDFKRGPYEWSRPLFPDYPPSRPLQFADLLDATNNAARVAVYRRLNLVVHSSPHQVVSHLRDNDLPYGAHRDEDLLSWTARSSLHLLAETSAVSALGLFADLKVFDAILTLLVLEQSCEAARSTFSD